MRGPEPRLDACSLWFFAFVGQACRFLRRWETSQMTTCWSVWLPGMVLPCSTEEGHVAFERPRCLLQPGTHRECVRSPWGVRLLMGFGEWRIALWSFAKISYTMSSLIIPRAIVNRVCPRFGALLHVGVRCTSVPTQPVRTHSTCNDRVGPSDALACRSWALSL